VAVALGDDWVWNAFWLETIRDFVIMFVAFALAYLAALRIFQREQRVADEARDRELARRESDREQQRRVIALDREHLAMAQLYKLALRGQAIHERAAELQPQSRSRDGAGAGANKGEADRKRLLEDFSFWQINGLSFIPEYADTEAGRIAKAFTARGRHVFWLMTDPTPDLAAASEARSGFNA
jgi:hypothetical protein